jgi:anti-sigma factor RsiW
MSPDEARDLFSQAFEGDLDAARREAFDAALASDEELRREYQDFVETFQLVARMGAAEDDADAPDLVRGVQERIRKRSRGRYYRDRFSQRAGGPGWVLPLLLAIVSVLVIATAWLALESGIVVEESRPPTSDAPATSR